jgi:hypothetical protein
MKGQFSVVFSRLLVKNVKKWGKVVDCGVKIPMFVIKE